MHLWVIEQKEIQKLKDYGKIWLSDWWKNPGLELSLRELKIYGVTGTYPIIAYEAKDCANKSYISQ